MFYSDWIRKETIMLQVIALLVALVVASVTASTMSEAQSVPRGSSEPSSVMWKNGKSASAFVDPLLLSNSDLTADTCGYAIRNFRGNAISRPCCVSASPGTVDCFIIAGPKMSVQHKKIETVESHTVCTEWEDLGGKFQGELECVSRSADFIDVFALTNNWALSVKSFTVTGWKDWDHLGNPYNEVPSCVARDDKKVTCLVRNSSLSGVQITFGGSYWFPPAEISGSLSSPIACSARTKESLDCFAVSWDDAVYTKYVSDHAWRGWTALGGESKGLRPSVAWNSQRMDLFVVGYGGDIIHRYWQRGWRDPVSLGGTFEASPECVMTEESKILCVAIGPHSHLYKILYDGSKWDSWVNLYGHYMTEKPSCVVDSKTSILCYMRSIHNDIIERHFVI